MEAISLDAQIACVRREIGMRERVYPKWVSAGRMKQDAADRELAAMRAVLATLEMLATLPGKIAYQLTKRLVIDMPSARAAVDAALEEVTG